MTYILRQIHHRPVQEAKKQLLFSPKLRAKDVLYALKSFEQKAIEQTRLTSEDMFIDQAWVVRDYFGRKRSFASRGRLRILKLPHVRISFVLRGKQTQDRRIKDAAAKEDARKPWVALKNRALPRTSRVYTW